MTKKEKREKKRGGIDNLTPFTSENQPSPEAKSKGWQRKRQAQKMMDKLMEYQSMTIAEIKVMLEKQGENLKVEDAVLLKYLEDMMKDGRARIDWMNRHIPYAPNKQELQHSTKVTQLTPEDQAKINQLLSSN